MGKGRGDEGKHAVFLSYYCHVCLDRVMVRGKISLYQLTFTEKCLERLMQYSLCNTTRAWQTNQASGALPYCTSASQSRELFCSAQPITAGVREHLGTHPLNGPISKLVGSCHAMHMIALSHSCPNTARKYQEAKQKVGGSQAEIW